MRLIDADALMKIVDSEIERVEEEMRDAEERPNLYTDEFRKHKSYIVAGMAHIAQDILEAPTVDAVPLDQCKECKNLLLPFKGCSANPCVDRRRKYDICSDGERKGDE